jgi:hypothetical protein
VQSKTLTPYHYFRNATLLFLFITGTLSALAQDSTRRIQPGGAIFPRVDSLKAAIVKAHLRPRIMGDTMEFNTNNARFRPNANVEELLGRLPGLQVDANGNITYNGEKIEHLLVDGEDIFGNDPTIVTRNFDADKIARIQIIDRKSDKTLFAGVDDGIRTKTLNLVLKENAKNGYFGKGEIGGNSDRYYNSNAALAAFKGKEQFTAVGVSSNTGVLSVTNIAQGTSSSANITSGVSDPFGGSAGIGVPQTAGFVMHYANTWNGPEDHVMANYQFGHLLTRPLTIIQTLQAEPGYTYQQTLQSASVNRQDQHWGYGAFDWLPAKFTTFHFTFRGNTTNGQNLFSSTGSTRFNDTLINSSKRTIKDGVMQQYFGVDASWRTTIKRSDRVLSADIFWEKTNNNSEGYILSMNTFYQSTGSTKDQDTINQQKQLNNQPNTIGGSINYTEPLWNGGLLAIAYGLMTNKDATSQTTYNGENGKYEQVVDSLSSRIRSQTISQRSSLNLQGKSRYLSYTIGGDWIVYDYRQRNLIGDSVQRQHYTNWAPRVLLTYNSRSTAKFQLFYSSLTQQPLANQLSPAKNNNDPIHISIGNPTLRPTVNQSLYLDYHSVNEYNLFLRLDFNVANSSISTKTITDSLGRQISQPVNVDGSRTVGGRFNITKTILDLDIGIHANVNYSRSVNYVNDILSRNNSYSGSSGVNISKNISDKLILRLNTNFSYFDQSSGINNATAVHYWAQSHMGALTIYLLRPFELNTNAVYTWQQKTTAFTANNSILLWNSSVSRNYFRDRLTVKAQWNNILNQNTGITRSNVNNTNTETSSKILGRYWMLSIIYHFERKFKHK